MQVKNLVEGRWNFEATKRQNCPPWGLWGGKPGEFGGYLLKRPGEGEFTAMRGAHIAVDVGASAIVRTGGGGGWGNPLERDPEAVAHDVREELISADAARRDYGVVVAAKGVLDAAATAQLRGQMRKA